MNTENQTLLPALPPATETQDALRCARTRLKLLDWNGQPLRYFLDEQSRAWFLAKDLGDILELGNIRENLRQLDEDEKLLSGILTAGQRREMAFVNEPGLYQLIFVSRSPVAKLFKKWLAWELLPKLRKDGRYDRQLSEVTPELMAIPIGRRTEVVKLEQLMQSIEDAPSRRERMREISFAHVGVRGYSVHCLANKFYRWLNSGRDWRQLDRCHFRYGRKAKDATNTTT